MSFEFPLVLFTILSQLAVGLAFLLCRAMLAHENESISWHRAWLCTAAISAAALIASLWHLGHPFEAFRALENLFASSLSWEVLGFSCFTALAVATYFSHTRTLAILTTCVGAFSLFTQGLTYAPPSMPAIHNALPMAIFLLSAIALGGSALTLSRPQEFSLPARISMLALIVALLAGPAIWESGSATMQATASLWLHSPWFWAGLFLIVMALITTWFDAGGKFVRFASLLCGIFFTRMVFFADTVHTATNLGLPFN